MTPGSAGGQLGDYGALRWDAQHLLSIQVTQFAHPAASVCYKEVFIKTNRGLHLPQDRRGFPSLRTWKCGIRRRLSAGVSAADAYPTHGFQSHDIFLFENT